MQSGLHPYADFANLRRRVERALRHALPFHGSLYRACDPIYANTRDLLSGEGSRRFGGRWNTPGSVPVIYLSRTIKGAMAESIGLGVDYGFDPRDRLPITLVAIDVDVPAVLDLTLPGVRRILEVNLTRMRSCDWRNDNAAGREAMTQALGRACSELRCGGIIVPSALNPRLRHLNVLPRNLEGDHLRIRRSDRLPPQG